MICYNFYVMIRGIKNNWLSSWDTCVSKYLSILFWQKEAEGHLIEANESSYL